MTQWSYCSGFPSETSGSRSRRSQPRSAAGGSEKAKALEGVHDARVGLPVVGAAARGAGQGAGDRGLRHLQNLWPKRPDSRSSVPRFGSSARPGCNAAPFSVLGRAHLPDERSLRPCPACVSLAGRSPNPPKRSARHGNRNAFRRSPSPSSSTSAARSTSSRRQLGAVQPRARPGPCSRPIAGPTTSRMWSCCPTKRRADRRGCQAREPRANPGRSTGRCNRADGRGRSAPARNPRGRQAHETRSTRSISTTGRSPSGPGINMLKLSQELQPARLHLSG